MTDKKILGHLEVIDLPDLNVSDIVARVDSGAHVSAIWASEISETEDVLKVVFFDKTSPYFTGETVVFDHFKFIKIKSSNGLVQRRYKVLLNVKVNKFIVKEWFTLADRSKMKYSVLIGRNILKDRFLIDVSIEGNISTNN